MCSFFSWLVSSVCSVLTFLRQSLEACSRSSHTQLLTCLPQMAFHFLKGFYSGPFHPLSEKEVFLLFAKSTPPCIDLSTKDNHSHLLNLYLFILLYIFYLNSVLLHNLTLFFPCQWCLLSLMFLSKYPKKSTEDGTLRCALEIFLFLFFKI